MLRSPTLRPGGRQRLRDREENPPQCLVSTAGVPCGAETIRRSLRPPRAIRARSREDVARARPRRCSRTASSLGAQACRRFIGGNAGTGAGVLRPRGTGEPRRPALNDRSADVREVREDLDGAARGVGDRLAREQRPVTGSALSRGVLR